MAINNQGEKKINIKDWTQNRKVILWMSVFTTEKE